MWSPFNSIQFNSMLHLFPYSQYDKSESKKYGQKQSSAIQSSSKYNETYSNKRGCQINRGLWGTVLHVKKNKPNKQRQHKKKRQNQGRERVQKCHFLFPYLYKSSSFKSDEAVLFVKVILS